MKLFLDTSVLLAASGSAAGASRAIFSRAVANGWELITTPYVLEEVERNLTALGPGASIAWRDLCLLLTICEDVLTMDRPVVFDPTKDRPILFGALAWAEVLLTLDEEDFGELMTRGFYDLVICRPGIFLERERAAGRLR